MEWVDLKMVIVTTTLLRERSTYWTIILV